MAKALLITREDIVKKTALNGNVDTDEFIQFVEIAQDIHIQSYLGTDLLEKIQSIIAAGTIDDAANADYKTLLVDYVKDMLIHWSLYEYLPWAAYTIANKGVYKHLSENAESVSKNEVDYLQEKQKTFANNYTQRFIDFMSINAGSKYPEYYSNTNDDVSPDKNTNLTGWQI
jgi:hypothetical protein